MAYYTAYELTVDSDVPDREKSSILRHLKKMDIWDFVSKEDSGRIYASTYSTWYSQDEDMAKLSLKHPGILFTLYGDGDSSDDMWVEYYYDGMCQHADAEIVYEKFDKNKLRPV